MGKTDICSTIFFENFRDQKFTPKGGGAWSKKEHNRGGLLYGKTGKQTGKNVNENKNDKSGEGHAGIANCIGVF